MPETNRKHLEAVYKVFQEFALEDQRLYYQKTVAKNRKASTQVNRLRAFFALLTGLTSALGGLLVATNDRACFSITNLSVITTQAAPSPAPTPGGPTDIQAAANCGGTTLAVGILLITAVIAPVAGAAFSSLADLYQWDRLINIYESALENIQVADAKSPLSRMNDTLYLASLKAYTTGTLSVMRDETAQWGQLIKTPEQLQSFINRQVAQAQATLPGKDAEAKAWALPNPSEAQPPAETPAIPPDEGDKG